MATESILRPGELKDILLREIAAADITTADVSEVGTVLEVRDGIARIYGLQSAVASEMLEFTATETGETVAGLVLNLEEDNVGAAILGDYLKLKEGDKLHIVEQTERGIKLSPYNPKHAKAMEIARRSFSVYADTYKALAK